MSSYKIEPLAEHEWGYRATVRLMWHHRWVVLLLCVALMALSNLGAVPLDEWIITEFLLRFDLSRFGHRITLYSLIILPIVTVSLISLLLKSEGITTSWRARGRDLDFGFPRDRTLCCAFGLRHSDFRARSSCQSIFDHGGAFSDYNSFCNLRLLLVPTNIG